MLISVCSFVRPMKTCLEHTIFIFWPQILQDDFRMTSGRLQEDFRKTSGRLQEDFRKTSERLQTYLMLVGS